MSGLMDHLRPLRDRMYHIYRPSHVNGQALHALLNGKSDVVMRDQRRFLFLEPIKDKTILPIVTLQSSDDWIHFRIYVLLTLLDDCFNLRAVAVRFETDEGDQELGGELGSHDFCHAQLCRSIKWQYGGDDT